MALLDRHVLFYMTVAFPAVLEDNCCTRTTPCETGPVWQQAAAKKLAVLGVSLLGVM